jgi:hypothetical protein
VGAVELVTTDTTAAPAIEAATPAQDDDHELREWLTNLLPKAAHKKIPALIERIRELTTDEVDAVEVNFAKVPVETVSAYGLTFELDAKGDAVTVTFPYGAFPV